ncbi:MAG: tetratricopeptide repeat protein, partial [Moorea sp. SIO3G5]|nr:tetratricopeptide repeat protein [Moorena sp. SIO3G5]
YHPHVAESLNNLANLYRSMGCYDQAEPIYVQALEIAERKLGSNHPKTVTYRDNLERLRDIRNNP